MHIEESSEQVLHWTSHFLQVVPLVKKPSPQALIVPFDSEVMTPGRNWMHLTGVVEQVAQGLWQGWHIRKESMKYPGPQRVQVPVSLSRNSPELQDVQLVAVPVQVRQFVLHGRHLLVAGSTNVPAWPPQVTHPFEVESALPK